MIGVSYGYAIEVIGAAGDNTPLSSFWMGKEHAYAWRADGSSSTQGIGSLSEVMTGSISCELSLQVAQNQIDSSVIPGAGLVNIPGSGVFIKKVCSGGESGGTVRLSMNMPERVFGSSRMIGRFYFVSPGYNNHVNELTFYVCSETCVNRIALYQNETTTYHHRQEGWNLGQGLCTLVFPNWVVEAGSIGCGSTMTQARIDMSVAANTTVTLYFGDLLYDYVAKAQIMVWSADNHPSVYTTMWPYMNEPSRHIIGSYAPTSGEFDSGGITVSQLQEMRASGWGVYGHQSDSSGLNYTTLTDTQLDVELQLVRTQLVKHGFEVFNGMYVYPGGNRNVRTDQALVRNGFSGLAVGGNLGLENTGRPMYGGMYNNKIWSVNGDAQNMEATREAIDHAVLYGEQLAILYHSVPTSLCDVVCFQTTIDYLVALRNAGSVDVVTFDGVRGH